MHSGLWGGPSALEMEDGRHLRLLSAIEVLEARREAQGMARDGQEQALCSNACLLARAVLRNGRSEFRDGNQVLEQMTAEEIGALAERWSRFNAKVNPGLNAGDEQVDELKNVWSTHGKSGCTGACCDLFQPCPRKTASEQ